MALSMFEALFGRDVGAGAFRRGGLTPPHMPPVVERPNPRNEPSWGNAPAALRAAAIAAASALRADPNYCASVSVSGTAANVALHAFKVEWNTVTAGQGAQPLPYNGRYDVLTAEAIQTLLGGASTPLAC